MHRVRGVKQIQYTPLKDISPLSFYLVMQLWRLVVERFLVSASPVSLLVEILRVKTIAVRRIYSYRLETTGIA